MVSVIRQRLLNLSTDIAETPADELAFQHSILAQTSLPAARPPDDLLVWERRQGDRRKIGGRNVLRRRE